jgi:hypothetical protein
MSSRRLKNQRDKVERENDRLERSVRRLGKLLDWVDARGPEILEEIADAWRDPNCGNLVDAIEDVMESHGSRD